MTLKELLNDMSRYISLEGWTLLILDKHTAEHSYDYEITEELPEAFVNFLDMKVLSWDKIRQQSYEQNYEVIVQLDYCDDMIYENDEGKKYPECEQKGKRVSDINCDKKALVYLDNEEEQIEKTLIEQAKEQTALIRIELDKIMDLTKNAYYSGDVNRSLIEINKLSNL